MAHMTIADLTTIRAARDAGMPFTKIVAGFATKHDRDTVLEAWHALTMRTPEQALRRFNDVMAAKRDGPVHRSGRRMGEWFLNAVGPGGVTTLQRMRGW